MDYRQFLMFFLAHLNLLPLLAAAVEKIVAATGAVAKWDAIKSLGDILAPVIEELMWPAVAATETEAELEGKIVAGLAAMPQAAGVEPLAWDGSRLRTIFKVVGPLLPILLQLLTGLTGAASVESSPPEDAGDKA